MAAASRAQRISSAALAAMALTSKGKADGENIEWRNNLALARVGAWRQRQNNNRAARRGMFSGSPLAKAVMARGGISRRALRIAAAQHQNRIRLPWRGAYRAGLRTYVMARLYCVFSRGASFGQPRDKRSRLRVAPGAKAAL
jgi:hypothetical protein